MISEEENKARLTMLLSGYECQIRDMGDCFQLFIAYDVEAATAGDWIHFPEYDAPTREGVLNFIVRYGLGKVIGVDREEYSEKLDERLDAK